MKKVSKNFEQIFVFKTFLTVCRDLDAKIRFKSGFRICYSISFTVGVDEMASGFFDFGLKGFELGFEGFFLLQITIK